MHRRTATTPPAGATVPVVETSGRIATEIAVVFSAPIPSPGRADTARAFKDRNRAPIRSSVPMAVVPLAM